MNAWDYTDPVSEAQADLLQRDMGSKSLKMIITERGRDAQQIARDIEAEDEENPERPMSTMTRDKAPEPVAPIQPNQQGTQDVTATE